MHLKTASVLVIDDDMDVLTAVRLLLRPEVQEIVTEKTLKISGAFYQKKALM